MAQALGDGGQVLVLVPEIALTQPWLRRFEARFGVPPVAWHSDLRSTERRRAWRAAASGEARVIVGARPVQFLPCPRQSGRASWRERVCPTGWISLLDVALNQKEQKHKL